MNILYIGAEDICFKCKADIRWSGYTWYHVKAGLRNHLPLPVTKWKGKLPLKIKMTVVKRDGLSIQDYLNKENK